MSSDSPNKAFWQGDSPSNSQEPVAQDKYARLQTMMSDIAKPGVATEAMTQAILHYCEVELDLWSEKVKIITNDLNGLVDRAREVQWSRVRDAQQWVDMREKLRSLLDNPELAKVVLGNAEAIRALLELPVWEKQQSEDRPVEETSPAPEFPEWTIR